jgi:purine nucleosidase
MSETTIKVLPDTDIGSDIDDAVCLAYLLSQPRCNLPGITTVSGQATRRAELAIVLCRLAEKEVPIYPGIESPLLTQQKQPEARQAEAMGQWSSQKDFPTSEAIWFLRSTIRRYPGEIILLTIGPLTNIALLFSVDPEIPSLLRGLVMMCGVFTHGQPGAKSLEWNAIGDPYATAIVCLSSSRSCTTVISGSGPLWPKTAGPMMGEN